MCRPAVVVAIVGVIQQFAPMFEMSYVTIYIVAAGIFVLSILSVFGTLYTSWRKASKFCYLLTNRRAMVWKKGLLGVSQDNYGPDELGSMYMRKSWFVRGAGDLVFREETKVSESSMPSSGPRGSRHGSSFGKKQYTTKTIRYGYLNIDHLEDVHNLVRRTLLVRRQS